MGKIVAVFNQKGGVGKTSTVSCLATELVSRGKKVLAIDADQQENLSYSFKIIPQQHYVTIYDLLKDEVNGVYRGDLSDAIIETDAFVHLIPGSVRMAGMDRLLFKVTPFTAQLDSVLDDYAKDNNNMRRKIESAGLTEDTKEFIRSRRDYLDKETRYKEKLISSDLYIEKDGDFLLRNMLAPVKDEYDYILIDCPPALSSITINILTAADRLIIPMTPEPFAASGLTHLIANVDVINKLNNPDLKISGLLFTMVQPNLKVSNALIEQTKETQRSSLYIYETKIPRSTELNKAYARMTPLIEYNRSNPVRIAYSDFCDEFLSREEA
jgi:cellulose biosynthesis protein BcsQ